MARRISVAPFLLSRLVLAGRPGVILSAFRPVGWQIWRGVSRLVLGLPAQSGAGFWIGAGY
ncbi:MAG: hypothetical protein C5B50_00955 [Verrucomicrobia bacterium]|nr:MAG: hypothetical protein C5B50_00955 [Verrucomicrobiota bacterium]